MKDLTSLAKQIFSADRYATEQTFIEIDKVEQHTCQCRFTLNQQLCNALGTVMGGALFTLADFAVAVAANTDEYESNTLHWVSLNANINYLAPAKEGVLVATASSVHHGRSTALYRTTITRQTDGHIVAIVETTMIHAR
ncbi:MAG: PaaI family thioesterase [Bacteroidales bacterium]|nr:PaaI family thioesterase [Bacteroidales bacterium]MBR1850674.1 PaaI family thioesterase [Bacteroidales bacterium]